MTRIFVTIFILLIGFFQPDFSYAHPIGFASIDAVIENKTLTAKFKYPDKVFTVGPEEVLEFFNENFQVFNNDSLCHMKIEDFMPPTDTATFTFTCNEEVNNLKVVSLLSENLGYTYPSTFKKEDIVKNHTFDIDKVEFEATFNAQTRIEELVSEIFDFIKLGIEHIYTGYDHILFILAAILVIPRFRQVIKTVTAFTIAHSVTLIVSSLGLITLTSRIVEPIIALSIAYIAFENIFGRKNSNIFKRRWLVAFGFGLIHGLGFAGALKEINIPKDKLLVDLVSFNIGIELGQLTIIAVVLPLLYFFNRFEWKNKLIYSISLLTGVIGLFWFLERVLQNFTF